jgi:excisionase family DNA binding protein
MHGIVVSEKVPFSERRALRMDEATQYSGLGKTSIYDAIRAGKIKATKVGKRRLIFRESLDRFLTSTEKNL